MEVLEKVKQALELYAVIIVEQFEKKKFFINHIYSDQECLLDIKAFDDFLAKVTNYKEPIFYGRLEVVFKIAEANMFQYQKLVESQESENFSSAEAYWEIDKYGNFELLALNAIVDINTEESPSVFLQQLENYNFIDFCYKIIRSVRHVFSDNHPILTKKTKESPGEVQVDNLFDLFLDPSIYPRFMDLLVENNLCQTGTYYWKDEKKGSKQLAIAIIKKLTSLGYYKKKPKNEEVIEILKNTFNLGVKIDHVKHIKGEFSKSIIKIPSASTLSDLQNTQNTQV